jgi:PHD/YefM family antitoxin component YafN of YafNO toxin-antitoxin module
MTRVSVGEARSNLSEIVNRIAFGGERIVLQRYEKDVVALVTLDDLALLQKIEDMTDIEASHEAMEEPGESISHEEVGRDLGLA